MSCIMLPVGTRNKYVSEWGEDDGAGEFDMKSGEVPMWIKA